MNGFRLHIFDSRKGLLVDDVISFVGEDGSGSFGIMPGHARLVTVLGFGFARFRRQQQGWEYLAMPGAVLYFADNLLSLACRHYLVDRDYDRISKKLVEELAREEEQLREVRQSVKNMEEALLKRLWKMRRQGVSVA